MGNTRDNMNNEQLKLKVIDASEKLLEQKGFVAPVEVLIAIGALAKNNYEAWRRGSVPYLERVCTMNLSKISLVLQEINKYANSKDLKASFTAYNQWGKNQRLSFSKSGNKKKDKQYSTHYINKVVQSNPESI
jgi:hypothetical protein